MSQITVNGQSRPRTANTVAELLQQLQLAASQVAVELNGTIVVRESFVTTPLATGDRIEIVRFVGGG